MKNKGLIATIIILLGVIVILLITLLLVKMPAFVEFDGFDFLKKETVEIENIVDETILETSETVETIIKPTVEASIKTYEGYKGNVVIEYPEITGMDDVSLQKKINDKLRTNALSIVPLYPVSTALQDLHISCEVNSIDEKYITVLYSGELIGKKMTAANANSKTGADVNVSRAVPSNNQNVGAAVDLNALNAAIANAYSSDVFNALPLPKTGGAETTNQPAGNQQTPKNQLNGIKSSENEHTADKGPTVYIEPAPSKDRALNNMTSQDIITGPGVSGTPQQGAPVNSFTGTSGSASTVDHKIFYANTIDLKTGLDVKLSDIANPKDLARYARSNDAEFVNVPESQISQVRAYIKKTNENKLTDQLTSESDFRNADLKIWPKHFSFIGSDGNIYFTIKLSSKLGNYVIIKYQK